MFLTPDKLAFSEYVVIYTVYQRGKYIPLGRGDLQLRKHTAHSKSL